MDQDAFRRLLSTGTQKQNGSPHARSLLPHKVKDEQKKATDDPSSKAAFKPRKIKKQGDSAYRDRAAERRTGAAGDFAEVEAVLESFEKQNADEDKEIVEERRKYLGGDAEHSVLVKGLDFALLEQTKARLAASEAAQDDEELEEAFRGTVPSTSPGASNAKKRTREDIIRELKNKRVKGEANEGVATVEEKGLEEVKREGKFKPIGFKPIGTSSAKASEGKEVKKKKKKKVTEGETNRGVQGASAETSHRSERRDGPNGSKAVQDSHKLPVPPVRHQPQREPEPVNEDFDIFADAGEYEGINLGDDDEGSSSDKDLDVDSSKLEDKSSESRPAKDSTPASHEPSESRPKRKWIEDEDEPLAPPRDRSLPPADSKGKRKESSSRPESSPIARKSPPGSPRSPDADEHESVSSDKPAPLTRLAPLASSALPSVRDILAADSAREAEEKRKARKEKQKHKRGGGGGGDGEGKKVSAEAKLNREYQKLKSYTEKKGGGGL